MQKLHAVILHRKPRLK